MSNRLSGARAHVLVQEVLAQQFPGQGFTGAAMASPQHAYPQNLRAVIEKFDTVGRRHAVQVGGEVFEPDQELTEEMWKIFVRQAAEAVQNGIDGAIKAQTASEPSEPVPGSSDPIEVELSAERPAEAQDGVSA